jgi:transcriptional regulator with XRE-family HTH domain
MTNDAPKLLGAKLRALRKSRDLTLDALAAELGREEHSRRSRVEEWETGSRIPSVVTVLKYSRFFDVSTDDLLKDEKGSHLLEIKKPPQKAR